LKGALAPEGMNSINTKSAVDPQAEVQNVPKIVQDRLKATAPAVTHPDADVLTAFTERSLPDRERAGVLEHLAICGDCRDIVAFALPATEAAQTVIRPARGWLTWPALRWGFAAAGIVTVASFGIFEFQRQARLQQPQGMMVAKEFHQQDISTNLQQPPSSAATSAREQSANEQKKELGAAQGAAMAPSVNGRAELSEPDVSQQSLTVIAPPPAMQGKRIHGSARAAMGGAVTHGPEMPSQWQQQQQRPATSGQALAFATPSETGKQPSTIASASPPIPPAAQTVKVIPQAAQPEPSQSETSQTQASQTQTQNLDQSIALSGQNSEQLFDRESSNVLKAKPVTTTARGAALKNTPPRWEISSTGGLQRSFDQGSTWQDVDVTASLASASELNSLAPSSTVVRAKEKDKAADKKALTTPVSALVFRAVAVNGMSVWAGGSNGALYHSRDAGSHWTQVVPASAGAGLTGDIIGLDFSDAKHGRVRTSNSEIWITLDEGHTWQKQ
jgi:hypothetical protein